MDIKPGALRENLTHQINQLKEENERLKTQLAHNEQKRAELEILCAKLQEQCSLDPRTSDSGILNPAAFEWKKKEVESLFDRGESSIFALLMIDIDGFKGVNDTLGHPIGDKVITSLAKTLRRSTRAADTVAIARPGGDEFAVILKIGDWDEDKIASRAKTIEFRFREDCSEYIGDTPISLSFGLEIFDARAKKLWEINSAPSDNDSIVTSFVDEVERHADLCLLEAKRRGKKRICWRDSYGTLKEKTFE